MFSLNWQECMQAVWQCAAEKIDQQLAASQELSKSGCAQSIHKEHSSRGRTQTRQGGCYNTDFIMLPQQAGKTGLK